MTNPYDLSIAIVTPIFIYFSPSRSFGNEMFGEGNVGSAFEKFPQQHKCNEYCSWFKLTPFEQADTDATGDGNEKRAVSEEQH
jgi:hypothetical protein